MILKRFPDCYSQLDQSLSALAQRFSLISSIIPVPLLVKVQGDYVLQVKIIIAKSLHNDAQALPQENLLARQFAGETRIL